MIELSRDKVLLLVGVLVFAGGVGLGLNIAECPKCPDPALVKMYDPDGKVWRNAYGEIWYSQREDQLYVYRGWVKLDEENGLHEEH